jgi:hypothetical protein
MHKRDRAHHEGDIQISKAYRLGDRTPGNVPNIINSDANKILTFLYLNEAVFYQLQASQKDGNIRRWIVLCEKLPEANASKPR